MAGGKTFPDEPLPKEYFQGQRRIHRDSGDYPDLATMLSAMRKIAGGRTGTDTIANGTSSKAVTFATAFPAGTTVRVFCFPRADIGATNSLWAASVSVTGFTATTTGNVGADVAFDYLAVAE